MCLRSSPYSCGNRIFLRSQPAVGRAQNGYSYSIQKVSAVKCQHRENRRPRWRAQEGSHRTLCVEVSILPLVSLFSQNSLATLSNYDQQVRNCDDDLSKRKVHCFEFGTTLTIAK